MYKSGVPDNWKVETSQLAVLYASAHPSISCLPVCLSSCSLLQVPTTSFDLEVGLPMLSQAPETSAP